MKNRKESLPLEKETINLFAGEFAELQKLHPDLGAGKVIRELVHAHILKVRGKLDGATDE